MTTAAPPTDAKAVGRLAHCVRVASASEVRPRAHERLEAAIGGDLAHRLVGALAGNHGVPGRLFVG